MHRLVLAIAVVSCVAAGAHAQLAQQAYVKASNTGAPDEFGFAVVISGNTAVVGARFEASGSGGVNGNQLDNSANNAGAAYVFVRTGTTWSQQAYLKPLNPGASDVFGQVLAISGDTIVVGASGEDSANASNPLDNSLMDSGAAYVFVRNGTTWTQQAYLKASNPGTTDHFGWCVSIAGDTIVVGAHNEDSSATGVNGNQASEGSINAGAAYVFVRSGTTWSQQAYLKASNSDANDSFGSSAATSGDTIVIGAIAEDSSAGGVNGNQSSQGAPDSGAAYVFVRSGTTWSQQAYLKASSPGSVDLFGLSAAISGDTIVLGAPNEDSGATGLNGNQLDNSQLNAGAAYVFTRSGTTWSQQAYVKATNAEAGDDFGTSVAIAGNTLVIGAERENSSANGVNGNQADNGATFAGAAYVYARTGSTWIPSAYVKASNPNALDEFGFDVAVEGTTIVVGAPDEDSLATGIGGNQSDNGANLAGAVYVFDESGPWHDLGFGLGGSSGIPQLVGTGTLQTGSSGSLVLTNAAPNAPAAVFVSFASSPASAYCGTLVPFPAALVLVLSTDGVGGIPLAWPAWPPGASGLSLYFQWIVADAAAPCTASLSNAVRGDVP